MKREDDFEVRREHLKKLSDEEIYNKFWSLAEKIVDPLIDLAYKNTSPSIERSVLLRMGFSSMESEAIVKEGIKRDLMRKGMGNVVLKYSEIKNMNYLEAGKLLANGDGWEEVLSTFKDNKEASIYA